MRKKSSFFLFLLIAAALPAAAYSGLSVSTAYPSIHTGETDRVIFDLAVKNFNLPPQRVNLSVTRIPDNWEYSFVGGGGLIDAVFVEPDKTVNVQLWLQLPENVRAGEYAVNITARGNDSSFTIPLTVKTGGTVPQRLSLDPELPSVRGTPSSDYTFPVTLHNNSAAEVMVNLDANYPEGFKVSFRKKYESGEISTLSVDSGKSVVLEVKVTPSQRITEGKYNIELIARSEKATAGTMLELDIRGQANLLLSGRGGLLSGTAVAGKERTYTLTVRNTGTAEARNIGLSSTTPNNWKVEFNPETIDKINPDSSEEVKVTITPSSESITGDYNVTIRANADTVVASERFRITVRTSALWGIAAVFIIAAAAVVLVFSVRKFGRR